jgi:5-(carboxyamino)imidazole ribonucleotide mutase
LLNLVSVGHHARTLGYLQRSGRYGMSFLRDDQLEIGVYYAKRPQDRTPPEPARFVKRGGSYKVAGALAYFDCKVVSAHRTPAWMCEYATEAEARGLKIIIAGAGGAAHLPGMIAAQTILPVLGVPIQSKALSGLDSLLSIVQMPGGVPVGTLAIGIAGARNAGLLAVRILAVHDARLGEQLHRFQQQQTETILSDCDLKLP